MSQTHATALARLLGYVPKGWLDDLTDPQVRAEIVTATYTNRLLTIFTNIGIAVTYYFAYDFVREDSGLLCALALFCGTPLWQYAAEKSVKRLIAQASFTEAASWHYLASSILSSIFLAMALAYIMVMFLLHDQRGLNSPGVIGALFYYFAAIIKNTSVRLLCVAYTAIVLTPMAVYFFGLGGTPNIIVGVFVFLLQLVIFFFSKTMSQLITSRIKLNHEVNRLALTLTVERDRADAANAAKSRFFTAASHDARQPLQAIGLLYDSIASSPTMAPADRKVLDKIGTNLLSIRNLFNRVLDISRIETGSVEPHLQAVPLQNLFNALDAQMGELAASKNLWLRFAPTTAVVWHDPDLLERMVGNVIHNALKFTHEGGVWVGYRASRGVLEVRDSGVGVAPSEQQQIFEEFYQLDNTARKRGEGGGLGLGLSIVKRLATLTDTAIGLRSAPGQGTTFWMQLPLSEARIQAQPALAPTQATSVLAAPMLHGLSILLVEDDDELRELFAHSFTVRGAQVTACADVNAVATHLAGGLYDAVITDYRLGTSGSGVDVARLARQRLGAALPVIVITGDTSGLGLKEVAEQAHTWVLHKPVTVEQLVALLPKAQAVA
jgi:two-component system, sensor histidine kinase